MLVHLRTSLRMFAVLSLLTGLAYPAFVTGVAVAVFPHRARGSLVERGGKVVGSELIGQPFTGPRYFWSRPSATRRAPYDAAGSTGSNLGPSNPALRDAVRDRIAALRVADPGNDAPVPADLVTASASGLDPHISPAAALYQARRVARARGLTEAAVRELVDSHIEDRQLGVLGERRVNVLQLNLSLDALR